MLEAEKSIQYTRYRTSHGWEEKEGRLITEARVGLSVNGEVWLNFACTPADLLALGAGFLFNEGIIQTRDEIADIRLCSQDTFIDVWLKHTADKPANWLRVSGCSGGAAPSAAVEPSVFLERLPGGPVTGTRKYSPKDLLDRMEQLLSSQDLYRSAGGVHSSGLFDGDRVVARAEDIGRHNTLDKIAGNLLFAGVEVSDSVLLTTGRISSEMLLKAARLRVAVVVSRTSPTSESVSLAHQAGITLAGYARRDQFILYTHPERLMTP